MNHLIRFPTLLHNDAKEIETPNEQGEWTKEIRPIK
jgi:hypothetical protein